MTAPNLPYATVLAQRDIAVERLERMAGEPWCNTIAQKALARIAEIAAEAEPESVLPTPYGYCPICGEPGYSRERRLNGDDRCVNGHHYPSAKAVHAPRPHPEPISPSSVVALEESLRVLGPSADGALERDLAFARHRAAEPQPERREGRTERRVGERRKFQTDEAFHTDTRSPDNERRKPQPDTAGWIEWHGGKCPVPDGVEFEFKFREPARWDKPVAGPYRNAPQWRWVHQTHQSDIVAFRVIK